MEPNNGNIISGDDDNVGSLTDNADGNLEPSLIKEGAETIHDKPKF